MTTRQGSARGQRSSEDKVKVGGEGSAFSTEGDGMDGYKLASPIVMKPISQLPQGPRRPSRATLEIPDKFAHNPEDFNPDGSLKTVHRLPKLDQSYAEARKTRYVRHREQQVWEKSLAIDEIFEDEKGGKKTSKK